MNQITPEIIERLGLIKTDATDGVSFVADCTFWKVGDTGIWLTDYDIEWSPEFSTREANILKREDLVFIFNRKLNTKEVMSYESLLDKYALEVIIASLEPGLTRIRPMAKKQNPYLHQPNVDNTTVPPTKIKKGMA